MPWRTLSPPPPPPDYSTVKDKDKDKEALFNVAYNVTDNISSLAILRHNNYIF